MKLFLCKVVCAHIFVLSAASFGCSEPAKPGEFPDVATVVTAQMVKASNEVKTYAKEMEAYIECSGMTRREKDKAYEALEDYAESFNSLVRKFKARKD